MIRDFKKTKENLREIADVINSFKSEAVQLRLLELVLSMEDKEEEVVVAAPAIVEEVKPAIEKVRKRRAKKEKLVKEETEVKEVKKETRGRKPKKVEVLAEPEAKVEPKPEVVEVKEKVKKEKIKAAPKPKAEKKNTHERPGPSVILRTLVADKYFAQNRTIGDVVKYCLGTYQFQYASTDLSGTLARMVKENILKREKNAQTNQFEYSMV
jgi:hypothetical protein